MAAKVNLDPRIKGRVALPVVVALLPVAVVVAAAVDRVVVGGDP